MNPPYDAINEVTPGGILPFRTNKHQPHQLKKLNMENIIQNKEMQNMLILQDYIKNYAN